MTDEPTKRTPAKPRKQPVASRSNSRASSNSRAAANDRSPTRARARPRSELAAARDTGLGPIPGTSLAVHRFEHGALAGQPWIDGTGGAIYDAVASDSGVREIAAALASWTEDQKLKSGYGHTPSAIFNRNAYIPPDNIFDQMRMAQAAVEHDDVVGGLADTTEGLALNETHWESEELDEADVFNQWAGVVDLDSFIRSAWRELFTSSQYVAAGWWGFRDYKIRGRTKPTVDNLTGEVKQGQKRKAQKEGVYAPIALTVLDGTKIVPLGSLMFGQERLVWTANADEMMTWQNIADGKISRAADPIISTLFTRQYIPNEQEREMLAKLEVTTNQQDKLLELNPAYVWRHTLTRPHYKPWSDIRLKRIFRWLDLKQQLMAADRVALVGNANYILLVTLGTDLLPAQQPEIDQLNEQFAYVARLPVIIGDHRLKIEIITPKADHVLEQSKYETIDNHVLHSVLQTFRVETGGRSSDTTYTLARAIARGLDNRRRGVRRDFERLAKAIVDHPFNEGKFKEEPNLVFSPRNINLEMDQQTVQAILALCARGDLSRETELEELGFDQSVEAQRRQVEADYFDPIFQSHTPFDSPDNLPGNQGAGGDTGAGGRGGGALPPGQGGGGRPPGNPPAKTTPAKKAAPAKKATQPRKATQGAQK